MLDLLANHQRIRGAPPPERQRARAPSLVTKHGDSLPIFAQSLAFENEKVIAVSDVSFGLASGWVA